MDAIELQKKLLKKILVLSSEYIDAGISKGEGAKKYNDLALEISGASYCAFNVFAEDGKLFKTVALSGIDEHILSAPKFFGFDLLEKEWGPDPIREKKLGSKTISEFHDLKELTGDVLPAKVLSVIEKTFGLGQVAVVRTMRNNIPVGDFTLIFKGDGSLQNREIMSLFASQVGILIHRERVESALEQKIDEMEKMNKFMVDRELKIIELKDKLEQLKKDN
ncbi:MAG: hypothetical protein ACM3KH_00480 [Thiobacillus sp.]